MFTTLLAVDILCIEPVGFIRSHGYFAEFL